MRSEFWEKMKAPSTELRGVARPSLWSIGNSQGQVQGSYFAKSNWCMGNVVDYGPLLLIEEPHVTALELCRKGLGQKIASLDLNKTKHFCLYKR